MHIGASVSTSFLREFQDIELILIAPRFLVSFFLSLMSLKISPVEMSDRRLNAEVCPRVCTPY